MRLHKDQSYLTLAKARAVVARNFAHFGANKKQELVRLVFEVSQREREGPGRIVRALKASAKDIFCFDAAKKHLLRRRFPGAWSSREPVRAYLPALVLDPAQRAPQKKTRFSPRYLIAEEGAFRYPLAQRALTRFPRAERVEIKTIHEYRRAKTVSLADYNARRDYLFLVRERFDFFKPCPCTKRAVSCGYRVLNLGFGCIYDCAYCFLQGYVNSFGIVLPVNIESYFDRMRRAPEETFRMGTGEFSDSLMLDDMTEYSRSLIDFFKHYPRVTFEFKTKSVAVENILAVKPSRNIVISWSLNPQPIIKEYELFTASLSQRLAAMARCAGRGWRVGIHFDPVIAHDGWEARYGALVDQLFRAVPRDAIAWISIGTLRCAPHAKSAMERRFPQSNFLYGELLLDFDGKLRYPYPQRRKLYETMLAAIRRHSKKVPVYLCMEHYRMWRELARYRLCGEKALRGA